MDSPPFGIQSVRNLSFDLDSPSLPDAGSPVLVNKTYQSENLRHNLSSLFSCPISSGKRLTAVPNQSRLGTDMNPVLIRPDFNKKRDNLTCDSTGCTETPNRKRSRMNLLSRRCQSLELPSAGRELPEHSTENGSAIKEALDRVSENADLISDGSTSYCLPTIPGKHQDLKSISSETLARVLDHEFDDVIGEFVIVDCRYPYEFEGGHIQTAKNYYTRDAIVEHLVDRPLHAAEHGKRTVIIFHCEFSSERGPKMSRFLRSMDREQNKDRYPCLLYPEIYILHGGYKSFFRSQKNHCCPQGYTPMHHEDYKADMKRFRVKSKSWAGEKPREISRRGLRF